MIGDVTDHNHDKLYYKDSIDIKKKAVNDMRVKLSWNFSGY